MFGLYRQKIILLMILGLALFKAHAQKIKYQIDYDAKNVRWGFFLGYALTNYDIKYNNTFLAPINNNNGKPLFTSITSPNSGVLKAGALINIQLNDYFDLRVSPLTLSIYKRKILVNDSTLYSTADKAWFEFPVILKFKSERRRNSRMFMFTGIKYGKETNTTFKRKNLTILNSNPTKSNDICLEFGMGLDIFREYFKVTPEIHFSHGIVNLANNGLPKTDFMSYVDKLKTNTVSFILAF